MSAIDPQDVNPLKCSSVTAACPVEASIYGYYPSLGWNTFFLAIFTTCTIIQLAQGIKWRTWSYTAFVGIGCAAEAIGYVGRIIMHPNPFSDLGFKMQICCLTFAPALLAGGLYLTLKHLVLACGPQYSLLKPKRYPWILLTCDFLALVLQASGGGIAGASNTDNLLQVGTDLMLAGIAFQVAILSAFAIFGSLNFIRIYKDGVLSRLPADSPLRRPKFKLFCAAVTLSFIGLFSRSIYRLPEMAGGWRNPLMQNQTDFIILEGGMIAMASIVMTAFHPAYCFPQMYQARRGCEDEEFAEKTKTASSLGL